MLGEPTRATLTAGSISLSLTTDIPVDYAAIIPQRGAS